MGTASWKPLGWELPITELETLTLAGLLIVIVQSLGAFFQRLATERLERKVNGSGTGYDSERLERFKGIG